MTNSNETVSTGAGEHEGNARRAESECSLAGAHSLGDEAVRSPLPTLNSQDRRKGADWRSGPDGFFD